MGRSGGTKAKLSSSLTQTRNKTLGALTPVKGTPFSQEELSAYVRQYLLASGAKAGDIIAFDQWGPNDEPYLDELRSVAEEIGIQMEIIVSDSDPRFSDQVESLVDSGAVFLGLEYPDYAGALDMDLASGYKGDVEKYSAAFADGEVRWMNGIFPTRAWADKIYGDSIKDPAERFRALGEDFQRFLRIHPESTETWDEHVTNLKKRGEEITKMEPEEFQFNSAPNSLYPGDPGTDLTLKPIEGARFIPVELETSSGQKTIVNSPTEEVFFTPAPGSANGRASMSRPYFANVEKVNEEGETFIESVPIDGVVLTYKDGIVVDAYSAIDPDKNDLLKRDFIERGAETGQRILGEIGLVDPNSPIAKTKKTYDVPVIDENSGSHGGQGSAWAFSIEKEALDRGVLPDEMRDASAHVDLTFGFPGLDISLTKKDGSKEDLAKGGRWVGP
jgi:leucyl aminopeptidase (aminopeptidase T)